MNRHDILQTLGAGIRRYVVVPGGTWTAEVEHDTTHEILGRVANAANEDEAIEAAIQIAIDTTGIDTTPPADSFAEIQALVKAQQEQIEELMSLHTKKPTPEKKPKSKAASTAKKSPLRARP